MSTDPSLTASESIRPQRIGSGSFATVYVVRGQMFVFKVVQHAARSEELRCEFETLHTLYTTCNSDSVFAIPRALAFNDEAAGIFLSFPPARRRRDPRPQLGPALFSPLETQNAAYAMDRAHVLPASLGQIVRQNLYPAQHQTTVDPPYLCRLYFGRELHASRLINPVNFLIDVARYNKILELDSLSQLLPVAEVAEGMGEMLARIHWRAGFDGRDIEFVMGGSGYGGVRYYVIDFNQMRPFNRQTGNISELVDAFFTNDPYYPRPRALDALYESFKVAYIDACPEYRARAEEFLAGIEQVQAGRDPR